MESEEALMESELSSRSCSPASTGGAGNFALIEELYEYGIHDSLECPQYSAVVTGFHELSRLMPSLRATRQG